MPHELNVRNDLGNILQQMFVEQSNNFVMIFPLKIVKICKYMTTAKI